MVKYRPSSKGNAHGGEIIAIGTLQTRRTSTSSYLWARLRWCMQLVPNCRLRAETLVMPTATIPGLLESRSTTALVEVIGRSVGGILLQRKLIARDQDMVGAEAGIDGAHLLKAAQESAGNSQQHQSDGDLRNHQGRT